MLKATERAQAASVSTPTGQQLVPLIAGGAAVADPIATLATAGTISAVARIYESAAVRNALIKVSTLKESTKAFDNQITRTIALMNSISQTDKDK